MEPDIPVSGGKADAVSKIKALLVIAAALAVGSVLRGDETLTSGDAPSPGGPRFPHGFAWPTCAPSDGPAVEIVLTHAEKAADLEKNVPTPHISIRINRGFGNAKISPGDYPLKDMDVTLTFVYGNPGYKMAKSGILHITKVNKDDTIEGSYEADFGDDVKDSAPFTAKWVDRKVRCG
jgi:hypothetical protein